MPHPVTKHNSQRLRQQQSWNGGGVLRLFAKGPPKTKNWCSRSDSAHAQRSKIAFIAEFFPYNGRYGKSNGEIIDEKFIHSSRSRKVNNNVMHMQCTRQA
jgi:hypothetical protein